MPSSWVFSRPLLCASSREACPILSSDFCCVVLFSSTMILSTAFRAWETSGTVNGDSGHATSKCLYGHGLIAMQEHLESWGIAVKAGAWYQHRRCLQQKRAMLVMQFSFGCTMAWKPSEEETGKDRSCGGKSTLSKTQ